jgi:RNA polymerase sigma factor (sigma-70 family)
MTMTLSKGQKRAQTVDKKEIELQALFEEHWERLCQVVFRIVGDMDEAQDLVLETLLQLHQRPPRNPHNVSGWLYRVATNRGLNALRARERRQRYEDAAGKLELESSASNDPAAEIERLEQSHRVRTALAKIKPRSAQILMLRYSGFSYAEIAASVGVAPGSVGKLLARAEREFESRMAED